MCGMLGTDTITLFLMLMSFPLMESSALADEQKAPDSFVAWCCDLALQ